MNSCRALKEHSNFNIFFQNRAQASSLRQLVLSLILEHCAAISSLTSNNGNIDFLSKIANLLCDDVTALGIKNGLLMVIFISQSKIIQYRRLLARNNGSKFFKKVQEKKLVKSNKSKTFFVKLHFWQFSTFSHFKNEFLVIFEIAKKWKLAKKNS